MTKLFKEHADSAQMTEADRIAHRATWDAAILAAVEVCEELIEQANRDHDPELASGMYDCRNAVKALATE